MSASFSITIQGKGTFTASISDPEASVTVGTNTPASFTAEVAPVGPKGDNGEAGPSGVVDATAPITYDAETQTVGIDPYYLPLTGGTMSGIAVFSTDGNSDSEVGAWGLGVEKTDDHTKFAEVTYSDIFVSGEGSSTHLLPTGVQFPDATVQTTAYTGPTNPFDQSLNTTDNPTFPKITLGTLSSYYYKWDGSTASGGLFFDGSPVISLEGTGLTLNQGGTGITFSDTSVQTTAFPPSGGTTDQYIDGTGVLQAFPSVTAVGKLQTTVHNKTGATIPAFSLVYIDGKHGTIPSVALSKADAEATSRSTFGFTTAAIADNTSGTVIQVGLLEGVNTNAYAEGALLFLSPTVSGGFTDSQPYSPYHYVNVGTVIRAHPTLGTIQVRITNSNELNELSDVQVSSSVSGDLLVKNGSGYWVSQSKATAGIAPIASPTFTGTVTIPAGASISGYQTTLSSATTSSEGKIQLATNAEVLAGTNTSRAVVSASANALLKDKLLKRKFQFPNGTFNTQVSGTGASVGQLTTYYNLVSPNASIAGFARLYALFQNTNKWVSQFDWTKSFSFTTFTVMSNNAIYSGTSQRCGFGDGTFTAGVALTDPTGRWAGWKWTNGGAVQLMVHDGTTLTTLSSGYTPSTSTGQYQRITISSDGAGNVTMTTEDLTNNVTYTATTALGPVGTGVTSALNYSNQVATSTTHTSPANLTGMYPTFYFD